jgi:hypothetical protein
MTITTSAPRPPRWSALASSFIPVEDDLMQPGEPVVRDPVRVTEDGGSETTYDYVGPQSVTWRIAREYLFFVLRGAGARRDGTGVELYGYWLWGGADALWDDPATIRHYAQIGRVATAEEVAEAERTYHIPVGALRTRYVDYLRRLGASGADEAGRARDALATLES